ncbi:MAG: molybdate ABC transporter substrate-binding protein [Rhodothermales bacterium]
MARTRSVAARQIRRRLLILGSLLLALFALLYASTLFPSEGSEELTVFAAASLTDVMGALEAEFEAAYPDVDLVVSTGASSVLARQIEQDAPADVFFSASPVWMTYLAERGLLRYPARDIVSNGLVVIGAASEPSLGGLGGLLRFERIALADPESVPAGEYAREGLERAGLWDAVADRVVPTLDVRAAVAAVQTGAVPVAIVYATDVRGAADVRVLLSWPESIQPRIRYLVAVPRRTQHANRALEFVEFVQQSERIAVWRRYGFVPLAEPVLP